MQVEPHPLRPFLLYPALCGFALIALIIWAIMGDLSRSPGHGLGESWLLGLVIATLPTYAAALWALAPRLRRLDRRWRLVAVLASTVAAPTLLAIFASTTSLFLTGAALAGFLAVVLGYLLAAGCSVAFTTRAA